MARKTAQSGFTAVELLITLFVAAAFLIAAYQLFSLVIKDGGETRAQSRASNIVYGYMRQYAASSTTIPCTATTPLNNASINVDGLSNTTITIRITCLPNAIDSLSKVEATISYNQPLETVVYATYVSSSGNSGASDITDGLVGWWKFNGNADDSSGNGNNGTVLNANLTIGQNGQSDNAYGFNGTSAYIYKDGGSTLSFSDNFTLSAWVKPTAYHTTGYYGLMNGILARGPATTYNYALQLTDATTVSFIKRTGSEGLQFYHYTGVPIMTNIWTHLLVEIQGTTAVLYVNGTPFGTKIISTIAPGGSDKLYIGGVTTSGDPLFIGSIDDVRIFSRTLSSYEVQSIYNAGAQ